MELAVITFWQVVVLFLLMSTGALCVRTGVLTREAKPMLSSLLLYVVLPASVLNSYMAEYDSEVGRNILRTFLYSAVAISVGLALAFPLFRNKKRPAKETAGLPINENTGLPVNKTMGLPICRLACVFSNAAYMGFPLIHALFGTEGLLYASAYVTIFNILVWTVGVNMVSPKNSLREIGRRFARTPVLYATGFGLALYYLRIPVPAVVRTVLDALGGMTTPVAMMITGMLIVESSAHRLIRNGLMWGTVGARLLLVPAVCALLFYALGFRGEAAQVVLLLEACPCAAITSVFAVQFHGDEDLAGGVVAVSTLLSVLSLPLCAILVTAG